MIAARGSGLPALGLAAASRAEIVTVEFIEAGAPQTQLLGGRGGGELSPSESRQELAD